jgi:hypothetical protein
LRRLVKVSLAETGVTAARSLWRLHRDPTATASAGRDHA